MTSRILIIDDQVTLRTLLRRVLEHDYSDGMEWEIDEAADGQQALDLLNEHQYAAVVVDLMLPEVGGYDIIAAIRQNHGETKIVVLTGRTDPETEKKVEESGGADALLIKPIEPDHLVTELRNLVSPS